MKGRPRKDTSTKQEKLTISQAFMRVTVALPQAPSIEDPLPTHLTFFVDSRFTTAQRNRITRLITGVMSQWARYYINRDNGVNSPLKQCTARYARFNLAPEWFEDKIANGNVAVDVMMDGLTRAFIANGFGRAFRAQIMYPSPGTTPPKAIRGANASDPDRNSLSVIINPKTLSRIDLGDTTLIGSLLHAWLHRIGYRHPAELYTSYFIGEAAMCLMHGNTSKQSGVPDSRLTAFLD
ncbi:hypothetical protein [Paenibacillus sp.]|uniref:hypothetical protein n=1 Tax=Paenibacillus sp. TaxID=58172 RepID=UPI002D33C6CC|nr:hypothetical protein [Paenibacillus sp.]HZG87731.1 hypothetical protein [Paenibacillus sp.]